MNGYTHGKFVLADLMSADTPVAANQYNRIGSYTVKAGEVIFMGFGSAGNMHDAVGRAYAKLQHDTPGEMTGTWLIQIESAQDIPLEVLGTWRSEDFNTSATDKTKQLPWPMMQPGVSKDKKIVFYFRPDAAETIDISGSTISIDITRVLTN